ncbi:hypothetical protein KL86DES1_21748 [uncultured Desulfovibrio sp.]|uniref:Uncharacterized protein n=1 Tax=uncultured Desulfovibrio sp. TaxID=167968 RepID=A0A212L9D9_9BACT|nr:hypothetical protein KL86DES1_21748 [uncultured Desulfovibrio sp.]
MYAGIARCRHPALLLPDVNDVPLHLTGHVLRIVRGAIVHHDDFHIQVVRPLAQDAMYGFWQKLRVIVRRNNDGNQRRRCHGVSCVADGGNVCASGCPNSTATGAHDGQEGPMPCCRVYTISALRISILAVAVRRRRSPAAGDSTASELALEQINFEMLHISKCSFSRKMRFAAGSTPRCGALYFRTALEQLHFFKGKML